jgi:hypothetical protein
MPYIEPQPVFPTTRQLIAEAWQGFTAKWRTFLGLALLSLAPIFFLQFASALYVVVLQFIDLDGLAQASAPGFAISWGIQIIFWVAWLAALIGVGLVSIPALCGQLFVITKMKAGISGREAYQLGRRQLWAYVSVAGLVGLGVFCGLLLFVVPGIILAVWWGGALVVVVAEQLSGLAALRRSRELTRGFFWTLVQRWLALAVFTVGVQAALFLLLSLVAAAPIPSGVAWTMIGMLTVVQWLWGVFLIPFWVLLQYVVYAHLRLLKKDQPNLTERISPGAKVLLSFLLAGMGIFGTALLLLTLVR